MHNDIQKASLWKRIAAGILDVILLVVLATGVCWALSAALDYSQWFERSEEIRAEYTQKFNLPEEFTQEYLDQLTPEEYAFWLEVRNTHAAINGKAVKEYTEKQMLTWYNKLHTDSAEYKMWGNGIALPPALYCMQGIADALGGATE